MSDPVSIETHKRQGDIDALIGCLRTGDSAIRAEAAKALGELKDKRALEHLFIASSNDSDPNVRHWAAISLKALGSVVSSDVSTAPSIWNSPRVKEILERPAGAPIDLSGLTEEERDTLAREAKGMWADHPEITDSVQWVRGLRQGLSKILPENN